MKLFIGFLVVLGVLVHASCGRVSVQGSGNVVTEKKEVVAFTKVNIDAPLKAVINITQGTPSVTITGYENLLKLITVKEVNGGLEIVTNDNIDWETDKDIVVIIHTPQLTDLELHKSGNTVVKGAIVTDRFNCHLSGSTDLTIDALQTKNTDVSISGAGSIKINGGEAATASYEISGAGNVKALPLQSQEVTVEVSGAGTIAITALRNLNVAISGAGNVAYKGNPTINKSISGAGSLKQLP